MTAVASNTFAPGTCEFLGAFLPPSVDFDDIREDLLAQGYVDAGDCPHLFANKGRGLLVADGSKSFRACCNKCCNAATGQDLDGDFTVVAFAALSPQAAREAAGNPVLKRLLAGGPDVVDNSFLRDVAVKFVRYGSLSPRQVAAVESAFARADSRKQAAARGITAPAGKVEVVGQVVSKKVHHGHYGSTIKLTVKTDAGWTCWVSLPKGLDANEVVGKRISLACTVEPSHNDPAFAFGRRPTKAQILPS